MKKTEAGHGECGRVLSGVVSRPRTGDKMK